MVVVVCGCVSYLASELSWHACFALRFVPLFELVYKFMESVILNLYTLRGTGGQAAEGMGVPMCTLRNFPHLPDHCIEWARDIFELLFVKLGKNLEAYLDNPTLFVEKARDKAGSEAGASFFDLRALTSYAQLVARPSVGAAVQCAYDLFHFLFRDRILDLQNAFPKVKSLFCVLHVLFLL